MVPAPAQASFDVGAQLGEQLRTGQIRIPPYPAVASSLDRLSRDPKSTIADVTRIVATDAALAAAVLRQTSSAAMKSSAPATLEAAVKKLGLVELTRVVIATTVGAVANARGPLAMLRRDQWRRSLLAAMFCRELAARRGVAPDQAFLAGLLHDFGALVVLSGIEALNTKELPALPEATWRRLVEDLHIEHGMVVVNRWQLPEPIAEVVAHHHAPQQCNRVYRPLVQLVAIVDQIIDVLDRGTSSGIAALVEVAGLEHDERFRIGALMPKVAEQMAQFEAPVEREMTSPLIAIERNSDRPLEDGWPIDFALQARGQSGCRACALAPNALAFRCPTAMQPAWLIELVLTCPPDAIATLAQVKTCRIAPEGGYLVTAQPFGLAGADAEAWRRLVERTRPAAP